MPTQPIHAVRTPHQAERLGLESREASEPIAAVPIGRMCQDLALAGDPDAGVAGRADVWVATRRAIEDAGLAPSNDATAERRTAVVAAYDAAIGWLLRTGAPAGRTASRASGVGALGEEIAARLAVAHLHDARALSWLARRRAERGDVEIGAREVVVTGIVPGEIDTIASIEALHLACRRNGGSARIVLPRPEEGRGDGPIDEGVDALAEYLERRWGAQSDAPEIEWLAPNAERVATERIERIEAPSAVAEAREIAAVVARALAAGTAPEAVAIVVPRADDPIAGLVAAALADVGIPASREGGDPIESSPEAVVTLDLLAMASGRITRDGLCDLLRGPGIHAGSWVGAAHESEAGRLATSIAHRLRSIPVAVDRAGGARIVEALQSVDPRAAAAVARLVAQTTELGARRGRGPLANAWRDLAHRARLGQPSASELGAALRGEAKQRRHGSRIASARLGAIAEGARGVSRVIDTAIALADAEIRLGLGSGDSGDAHSGAVMDAAELLAEVKELAFGTSVGAAGGAPRAGAVRIATARDVVGLTHALVVVSGLGDRAYRASEVRGLVDEEALATLPELHRPPPLAARRAARSMELAWIARDAEHVVLTRRAGGASGQDEPPHRLFVALGRSAAGDTPAPEIVRAPSSSVFPTARASGLRDFVRARLASGAPASILKGAAAESVRAAQIASEERTRFFLDPRMPAGRFTGAIDARHLALLQQRFGGDAPDRSIAVTHVERAARCAFAGFASRVLRARRVEDALEDANPRERGTLVHGALFAAFEAMRGAPPSEDVVARRARAEHAALDHTRAEAATPLRREAILAAVRDAMAVVDLDLKSGDAAFYALGEQRFGAGSESPWDALALEADDDGDDDGDDGDDGGPTIWVDGQIDRIDRPGDGRWVRIVDYKTGKLPRKKDEHQTALQLSVYADAVARWAKAASGATAELSGRYVETRRGTAKVREVAVDDDARRAARRNTRRVVLKLWSGDLGARVVDPKTCRRCEARDLCRKPAVAVDEEVEADGGDAAGEGSKS